MSVPWRRNSTVKVVLFCGGLGLRIRDYSETIPKPLVPLGPRPMLWHVMKYYSHFGHKDFVLCLGYQGEAIKRFFLNYDECLSNDFVYSDGGKKLMLENSDIHDWKITFADTGIDSNIGQRLKAVQKYVGDEEVFLANYTDGLTDLHLPSLLAHFEKHRAIASFLSARPNLSFHIVSAQKDGLVEKIEEMTRADLRINSGYFAFRKEIFDYLGEGQELVRQPFQRLICEKRLAAYEYDGFFQAMDTFKDRQMLDGLVASGRAPWEVWKNLHAPDVHPEATNGQGAARLPATPVGTRHV
jgi:glucose-1-phosphate cytidylyltransferase